MRQSLSALSSRQMRRSRNDVVDDPSLDLDETSTPTLAQISIGAAALGAFVVMSTVAGLLVGVPGVGLLLGLVLVALIVLAALMI